MRFINSVLFAASALASFAAAQSTTLFFTKFPTSVTTGTTYPLEWKTNDNTTPVTITLKQGPSGDLKDVTVLTSNGENGKFSWTPSKSLSDGGNYALVITQGDQTNYGGPIALSGGSPSSASAASSTASASSASASSKAASSKSDSTLSTAAITTSASSGSASASASASDSSSNSKSPSAKSASPTAAASQTTGSAATSTNDAQGAPTSTGGAATLGSSPMALIFGAAAMMAYLN